MPSVVQKLNSAIELTENEDAKALIQESIDQLNKVFGKKSGAPKDPNAPKRKSPFNEFMQTEIARLKTKNPTLEHKDAFKQAAQNWKKAKPQPATAVKSPAKK